MSWMFNNAAAFNQNIGNWTTSNVTVTNMFLNPFNQNIGNSIMLEYVFNATSFNQNIGNWDTSNVSNVMNMSYLF